MVGLVPAGAFQVVHAGVNYHVIDSSGVFAIENGGKENSGAAHQEAAGLEPDGDSEGRYDRADGAGQLLRSQRGLRIVADPDSPSEVKGINGLDPPAPDLSQERSQAAGTLNE